MGTPMASAKWTANGKTRVGSKFFRCCQIVRAKSSPPSRPPGRTFGQVRIRSIEIRERVVSIDVHQVQRSIRYFVDNLSRAAPQDDALSFPGCRAIEGRFEHPAEFGVALVEWFVPVFEMPPRVDEVVRGDTRAAFQKSLGENSTRNTDLGDRLQMPLSDCSGPESNTGRLFGEAYQIEVRHCPLRSLETRPAASRPAKGTSAHLTRPERTRSSTRAQKSSSGGPTRPVRSHPFANSMKTEISLVFH